MRINSSSSQVWDFGPFPAQAAKWSHGERRQRCLIPFCGFPKRTSPTLGRQSVEDMSHQDPIHRPATILGENMEIEKLHIIRPQGEVMGLDGASLQGPSVPRQLVFKLDHPERSP